ncbi:asparagine synthase (glutamine-hydrolyzing) [Lentzea cavernae]|uniref:asparagine synthase (glutamine-hydrolyzing) n=1 Tax=Lentzea cavernae TaxID=2020703 RepID=UPI00174ACE3F|nr:asparagine synthase (glutamine-hydrolyzing) [Lentzea cavernae]
MCGLAGLVCPSENEAENARPAVEAALRCMRHRGPDESGTRRVDEVVFGFNRLAIIDIEHSHQPLTWGPAESPSRYTINFNGEIYNYLELRAELTEKHGAVFHTDGDTETIVAAYHYYGPAAITKLRGMFAFIIWDAEREVLFGGRDPFGIKPLYWAQGQSGVAFASEKKILLEIASSIGIAPKMNVKGLQHYLTLQYVPEPASLHDSIFRVESGHSFTLVPGESPKFERYFPAEFKVRTVRSEAEANALYDEITAALRDSVAKHMRADVTVGSFLSGGIDSTVVAALAKEHNPDLITFTTGFERQGFSEVDVAAESAALIGVKHVVRTVSAQEMMDSLPLITWYLDDPVADPALVPLWFIAREARQHVKVVLSGEGADELFGGYTIYREPLSLAGFEKVPGALRKAMGKVSTKIPHGVRGKDLLRRGALTLEERYYGNARIFLDDHLRQVLKTYDPAVSHMDATAQPYRESQAWDPVTRMQHVDLFTWLRGDILVKADKMTMANSLELRVPFLDPEVFRIASQIPSELKITKDTTKFALRKAIREIVPAHVLNRRKLGFPVPIRHWLKDEMHDWAVDIVRSSQTDQYIDKNAVLRLIEEHRSGVLDHSRRIWALLVFMIWHGIFVEGRIQPVVPEPHYPVKL